MATLHHGGDGDEAQPLDVPGERVRAAGRGVPDLPDVLIFVNKGVVVCHGRVHTVGAVHVDPLRGQVRD